MAVRLLRASSETPNITNTDDARMVRHSYGGYTGFVPGFGREAQASFSGSSLSIGSGVIVIDGWEVLLDEAGYTESFSGYSGILLFTVYMTVNLASETVSIRSTYNRTEFPVPDNGDDLTEYPEGSKTISLFHVTVSNGVIMNVDSILEAIPYQKEFRKDFDLLRKEFDLLSTNFSKARADLDSILPVDGNVSFQNPSYILESSSKICKQGRIVCCSVFAQYSNTLDLNQTRNPVFTVPEEMRPSESVYFVGEAIILRGTSVERGLYGFILDSSGAVYFSSTVSSNRGYSYIGMSFSYVL